MKKLFSLFILFSLFSLAFALEQDYYEVITVNEAGVTDSIALRNFFTEHICTPYFIGSGISTTETTITSTKTCDSSSGLLGTCNNTDDTTTYSFADMIATKTCNSTINVSGTCAGTNAKGGANYSTNETNSSLNVSMNLTINISNSTLALYNGTFSLKYRAGYFGDNVTGITSIYIWDGSEWSLKGTLSTNGFTDTFVSGLNPQDYAQGGIVQVSFAHSTNTTTNNSGMTVDYLALDFTQTPIITLNETALIGSEMNITINITSDTLGDNTSVFDLNIVGGYFGDNATGNTTIWLWKDDTSWSQQTVNLSLNSMDSITISDLPVANYVIGVINRTRIRFNHSINATSGNTGIVLDKVSLVSTTNTTVTSNANITMQASIDNVNWFDYIAKTEVTSPVMLGVNRTARYARFNVSTMLIGNQSGNSLLIPYAAIDRG